MEEGQNYRKNEVPIWKKQNLSVNEAAVSERMKCQFGKNRI